MHTWTERVEEFKEVPKVAQSSLKLDEMQMRTVTAASVLGFLGHKSCMSCVHDVLLGGAPMIPVPQVSTLRLCWRRAVEKVKSALGFTHSTVPGVWVATLLLFPLYLLLPPS